MKDVLIAGAGGHGKVVADLVRAIGDRVAGYADRDETRVGSIAEPGGGRIVATQTELEACVRDGSPLPAGAHSVALGIGDNAARLALAVQLGAQCSEALVHPSAVVSPSARLGAGTVVFPGAIINADARIGTAVIVNSGAIVEHDCEIGDGAHLSPGAVVSGGAHIGAAAWVGAGAVVIQRIRIGANAVVGAGAVVIEDVQSDDRVAGVPAKPLPRRE